MQTFSSEEKHRSIALAQNYLKNPSLAAWLIAKCGITETDTVVEIGPGKGVLTKKLAAITPNVIAIERDVRLSEELRKETELKNVKIINDDFLRWTLPTVPYKIFSNPPFNITSQIVKKLLWAANPPQDTYLFTQQEAAERFLGTPLEYELSIATKPWFTYDILHNFSRDDFSPVPSVEVVLLHIHARSEPLLPLPQQKLYRQFIQYAFAQQKRSLEKNLEKIFTYEQWKRLAKSLRFSKDAQVRDLTLQQWLGVFESFMKFVTDSKKRDLITSIPMR